MKSNLNAFDPFASPSTSSNNEATAAGGGCNNPQLVSFLQGQRFPSGLIQALLRKCSIQQENFEEQAQKKSSTSLSIPETFWILDNSIHMNVNDSHKICGTFDELQNTSNVSRWDELRDCVAYQAQMAQQTQSPLSFCFMNDPDPNLGPKLINIGQNCFTNVQHELQTLQNVMVCSLPKGNTSELTKYLGFVKSLILKNQSQLHQQNKTITVVLATQGYPTNERGESDASTHTQFAQMLQSFQNLPVFILLRLCTDNEDILDYYNTLDRQFTHLKYDVLDDYFGEALEVYLRNPWLTYTLPLHRFRELGYWYHCLDLLDERLLTLQELYEFCCLLFDSSLTSTTTIPNPMMVGWNAFYQTLSNVVVNEGAQWNPVTQKKTPWINLIQLNRIYGFGGHGGMQKQPNVSPNSSNQQQHHQASAFPNQQQQYASCNQPQSSYSSQQYPSSQQQPKAAYPNVRHQSGMPQQQQPSQNQKQQSQAHVKPKDSKTDNKSPSSSSEIKTKILTTWALASPSYQKLRPIEDLLSMVQSIMPPSKILPGVVDDHDHFMKWKPITKEALAGPFVVLKKAVRKMQLFLHPDKLPADFTESQRIFTKHLWDITSDAWDLRKNSNTK